jgi:hypothetical protein
VVSSNPALPASSHRGLALATMCWDPAGARFRAERRQESRDVSSGTRHGLIVDAGHALAVQCVEKLIPKIRLPWPRSLLLHAPRPGTIMRSVQRRRGTALRHQISVTLRQPAHPTPALSRPAPSYEKAKMRTAMIKMVTTRTSPLLSCSAASISSTPTAPVRLSDAKIV